MTNQRQLAIRTIYRKDLYFLLMPLVFFKKKKEKVTSTEKLVRYLTSSDSCNSVGGNGYAIGWESNAEESTWQPGYNQFLFKT